MTTKIAVLVPCYNESLTVKKVIDDFRAALPQAEIYVYDNNSSDATYQIAKDNNAIVRTEKRQGKGWVVRSMFAEIDADFYIMVDGDATYDASFAPQALAKCQNEKLDLLNIAREDNADAFRQGHQWGNKLFNKIVKSLFGSNIKDMLSGYKIFSRGFVKSFPALSPGFEIETELTIFAVTQGMKIDEITAAFTDRPAGSFSKLSTFKDGFKILKMIIKLLRYEKPLLLFSIIAFLLAIISVIIAIPLIITYMHSGMVPRFPTAILASGIMIIAFISFFCGLILDNITRSKRELQRIFYLNINN